MNNGIANGLGKQGLAERRGHDEPVGQSVDGPVQITSKRNVGTTPLQFTGTPVYVKQDMTLNYNAGGVSGPAYASTFYGPIDSLGGNSPQMLGPRGWITVEGTVQFDQSSGVTGAPLGMQFFQTYKNKPGKAVNLGSAYSVGVDPQVVADGATVGWAAGDYPTNPGATGSPIRPTRALTGFASGPWLGTINSGVGNWTSSYSLGFNSLTFLHGNTQLGGVIDYFANEVYLGTDGTNLPTVATHYGFYVQPLSLATSNIGVYVDGTKGAAPGSSSSWGVYNRNDEYVGGSMQVQGNATAAALTFLPTSTTYTASQTQISLTSTFTYSTTTGMSNTFLNYSPTQTWTVQAGTNFITDQVFASAGTYINGASANINLAPVFTFNVGYTKTIDTQTGKNIAQNGVLGFGDIDFSSAVAYTVANSGTFTSGVHTGFSSKTTVNGASSTLTSDTGYRYGVAVTLGTVTTANGFLSGGTTIAASQNIGTLNHFSVVAPTVTGTLANQFGLDIPALTGASTLNIGLRCTPAIVYPPTTCAVSSNAGTVPVTCSHAVLTNSSAATLTVTLATTNAQNGQEVLVRVFNSNGTSQTVTFTNLGDGCGGRPSRHVRVGDDPDDVPLQFQLGYVEVDVHRKLKRSKEHECLTSLVSRTDVDDAFAERDQITEQMQTCAAVFEPSARSHRVPVRLARAQGEDPTRPWEPPAAPPKPKSAKTRND
jgi:hypothetical protein